MKIIQNILAIPSRRISVLDMLLAASKTEVEAQQTIDNTGFSELRWCENPNLEMMITSALAKMTEPQKIMASDVDVIICVSQSQVRRIPNLAALIQQQLDIPKQVFCLDLIDGCNGFVKALVAADRLLLSGQRALIVSGEINSNLVGNSELGTKILFGDGFAFTVVLREDEPLQAKVFNDGNRGMFIQANFKNPVMEMVGFEVFRFANTEVPKLIKNCDWIKLNDTASTFALHQASELVTSQIGKRLGILNQDPALFNAGRIGNLGAGSIPGWLALTKNKRQLCDVVHCVGYGAGLSWGVATVGINLVFNEVCDVDI